MITTVGIEYTYMKRKSHRGYDDSLLNREYVRKFQKKGFKNAYDDDCIEIPSPPHRTYSGLKNYFLKLHTEAKKMKLVTHKKKEMNGGGHIHLGLQYLRKGTLRNRMIMNTLKDITNRPYLNWIFNEWADDWNANSLTDSNEWMNRLMTNDTTWIAQVGEWNLKDYAIAFRPRLNTLEFRLFDAKKNWSEVKDHVDFAIAYYKYVLRKTRKYEKIQVSVRTQRHVKGYTYRKCVSEFNKLLDELKLPRRRYKKYLKRNLKERFKHGELK